jgi:hypothetical protein
MPGPHPALSVPGRTMEIKLFIAEYWRLDYVVSHMELFRRQESGFFPPREDDEIIAEYGLWRSVKLL